MDIHAEHAALLKVFREGNCDAAVEILGENIA